MGIKAEPNVDRLSLQGDDRHELLVRLKRIEGQIRGLQRMVEEGRYCGEVLEQMGAAHAALRGAGEKLLQSHLRRCVVDAMSSADPARRSEMVTELAALFRKYAR